MTDRPMVDQVVWGEGVYNEIPSLTATHVRDFAWATQIAANKFGVDRDINVQHLMKNMNTLAFNTLQKTSVMPGLDYEAGSGGADPKNFGRQLGIVARTAIAHILQHQEERQDPTKAQVENMMDTLYGVDKQQAMTSTGLQRYNSINQETIDSISNVIAEGTKTALRQLIDDTGVPETKREDMRYVTQKIFNQPPAKLRESAALRSRHFEADPRYIKTHTWINLSKIDEIARHMGY